MAGELRMRLGIRGGKGVDGLAITRVTAGWIVKRYDPCNDDTDIIAGAFGTPEGAVDAARGILSRELDELLLVHLTSDDDKDGR